MCITDVERLWHYALNITERVHFNILPGITH